MDDFNYNFILKRSPIKCPIAASSAVLADQWSVIVLRDIAFFGKRTFRDILSTNNENIQSSTLAKRLKRMVDIGLLSFESDASHAQRKIYCLTQAGIDLVPIMVAMAAWISKHDIFNSDTIQFLEPLQNKNNAAMEAFLKKLRHDHLG